MLPSPLHKGQEALYIRVGRSSEAAKSLFGRRCGTGVAVAGSGISDLVEHPLCETVRLVSGKPSSELLTSEIPYRDVSAAVRDADDRLTADLGNSTLSPMPDAGRFW
jgi:hypothetical protein